MSKTRLYCSPITQGPLELSPAEAHHAAAVKRLHPGDPVELFDGAGTLATGTVTEAAPRRLLIHVDAVQVIGPPQQRRIIIAAAVARGERFDWLVAKCTELGVDRICPILFERTVKRTAAPKATQRYARVALAAAKQCGRLFLPALDPPTCLTDLLDQLHRHYPAALLLTGSFDPAAPPLTQVQTADRDVAAFVGPEGGLTDQEENLLSRHAAQPVRLTDTVLRVETAAVAFASVLATRRQAPEPH